MLGNIYCFYCDQLVVLWIQPILYLLYTILVVNWIHLVEMTFYQVLSQIFMSLLVTANFALIAAGIIYVKDLQNTLDSTNQENVKLLDAMHEGVLILNKNNKTVLFCN